MYFTCEGCFQDSSCRAHFTCKRYSSWLSHLTRPEHIEWSTGRYKQWSARENKSSIVVVIIPSNKSGVVRINDADVLEHFSADGIVLDMYFDRSGNYAVLQFDDVMPMEK